MHFQLAAELPLRRLFKPFERLMLDMNSRSGWCARTHFSFHVLSEHSDFRAPLSYWFWCQHASVFFFESLCRQACKVSTEPSAQRSACRFRRSDIDLPNNFSSMVSRALLLFSFVFYTFLCTEISHFTCSFLMGCDSTV